MTTPSARAMPPSRGSDPCASARASWAARSAMPLESPKHDRPASAGRSIAVDSWSWLPAAAREEAEQREDENHDEDDPEDAHVKPSFVVAAGIPGPRGVKRDDSSCHVRVGPPHGWAAATIRPE